MPQPAFVTKSCSVAVPGSYEHHRFDEVSCSEAPAEEKDSTAGSCADDRSRLSCLRGRSR